MKVSTWTKSGAKMRRALLSIALALLLAVPIFWAAGSSIFVSASGLSFVSDYGTRSDLREDALRTNKMLMEEGMTLLKNEGDALPMDSNVAPRVTVFGKNSVNPVWSGSGSSGGVNTANTVSPYTSLRDAGFVINPAMEALYRNNTLSGTGRVASGMNSYNMAGIAVGEMRATGSVTYADGTYAGHAAGAHPIASVPNGGNAANAGSSGSRWNEVTCPQEDLNYDPADTTSGYSNYESVRSSYRQFGDAAVVFISRIGGEGFDVSRTMRMEHAATAGTNYPAGTGSGRFSTANAYRNSVIVPGARSMDDHYLQLDQNETNMLREAAHYFDRVIVVINCATQMELGFLDDPGHYAYQENIKAALWVATPGENGFAALGPVLRGEVNPSGGLVSTWYRDFKADPTFFNIGNNRDFNGNSYEWDHDDNPSTPNQKSSIRFTDNQEGIYAGMRYYETRGFDEGSGAYVTDGATIPHINGTSTTDWVNWYDAHVVYPFGHGLSYTDFSHAVVGARLDGQSFDFASNPSLEPESTSVFEIDVKVTNSGYVRGKNAVELYVTTPYTDGEIEKSHKVLVGFVKSKMLAPGQSQVLTIKAEAFHMASFDQFDLNINTFKGYELEEGAYTLSVAQNAHDDSLQVPFKIDAGKGLEIASDPFTGNPIEISFEEESNYMAGKGDFASGGKYEGQGSKLLSRANKFANLSELSLGITRNARTEEWLKTFGVLWNTLGLGDESGLRNPTDEQNTAEWNLFWNRASEIPAGTTVVGGTGTYAGRSIIKDHRYAEIFELSGVPVATVAQNPYTFDHPETPLTYEEIRADGVQFWDMTGVPRNDPKWDQMMEQLTWQEISQLIGTGMYYNKAMDNIGKPMIRDLDGPVGWTGGTSGGVSRGSFTDTAQGVTEAPIKLVSTCIVAATFNTELANQAGRIIGEEGMWGFDRTTNDVVGGWYAPGANLHRSPFSGRNFEYYSENEYLTGRMAGAMMTGAQDKGIYAYLKHFFLNDTETDRNTNGLSTWSCEQSMREIWARGFEIGVKQATEHNAALVGIMTGYNRVGRIWVGGSWAANTQLLRNEWGFEGVSITDNTYDRRPWMGQEQAILSGSDKRLNGGQDSSTYNPTASNNLGSGIRAGFPAINPEILGMTASVTLPISGTVVPGADFANTYKWALHNAAKSILYTTCNSNVVNAKTRIVAGYLSFNTTQGSTLRVGEPVNYDLKTQLPAADRPRVLSGDQSAVNFTYSLATGSGFNPLPAGLTLSSDGVITGIPREVTTSSTRDIGIRVSAPGYLTGYLQIRLAVSAAATGHQPLTFDGGFLGTAELGQPFSATVAATRTGSTGASPTVELRYAVKSGYALPAGLSLDAATGVISGTTTDTGRYTLTVPIVVSARQIIGGTVQSAVLETAEAQFSLAVGASISAAQAQALIDAATSGKLTQAEVQALIDAAVSGKLTEAEVQALIDAALEEKGGCGGAVTPAGYAGIFGFIALILAGAAVFTVKRKKSENK